MSHYNSQGNDSNPPLTFPHWHKFMYSQCYVRNKHKRFPPWKKQAKWFGAARDEYLQINHRSKKKKCRKLAFTKCFLYAKHYQESYICNFWLVVLIWLIFTTVFQEIYRSRKKGSAKANNSNVHSFFLDWKNKQ